MIIDPEDLQKMSDEEVAALNRKLGMKVAKRFLTIMAVKWFVIVGTTYAAKKWFEKNA